MIYSFLKRYTLPLILISYALWFFFFQTKPCEVPIQYRIGTLDARFGITKEDFLRDINQSAGIWNKPLDKKLFEYNPNGKLVINLIYDTRQKTTQETTVLKADVSKINELAGTVKEQYLALQEKQQSLTQEYQASLSQFQARQEAYNQQVSYWNSQGGAPESEYNKLMVEKNALASEQNVLESKRLEANALVEQINTFIQKYNLLIHNANETIGAINQNAGKEFEEGNYDPSTNRIDIYEFSTNKKLLRVITHELGHAIGLNHNANPESIMYELNKGDTLALSAEDTQALVARCEKPYFVFNN